MAERKRRKIGTVQYYELSLYPGPKSSCANCDRAFNPGDVVSKSGLGGLVFCYSATEYGCLRSYEGFVLATPTPTPVEPMVYLRHTDPFALEMEVPKVTLWERIIQFLFGE